MLDKVLPYDLSAEQATLGAVLLQRDAILPLDGWLRPEQFYLEKHAWTFEAMLACYHRRVPPDIATVGDELRRRERLEVIGGLPFLIELANAVPSAVHVEYYAAIVERTAALRGLVMAGGQIAALGFDEADDLDTKLAQAEAALLTVSQGRKQTAFASLRDLADGYYHHLRAVAEGDQAAMGLATGYSDLDAILCGLQRSDLVILAARPAVGKTSLSLSLTHNVARQGAKVALFSLEMSRAQYFQRLLAMETGLSTQQLRMGAFGREDLTRIMGAMGQLAQLPVFVEDTPGISVQQLRALAHRKAAEENGLDLLVVDYLQLMSGARAREGRVQEVSEISRGLKQLARELDVPLLALSQLSRAVEGRASHVPVLSDLRESGQIEADADVVLLLYREELYDRETDKQGIVEVHVAKHRNGPLGIAPLRFEPATTRFHNLERYRAPAGF